MLTAYLAAKLGVGDDTFSEVVAKIMEAIDIIYAEGEERPICGRQCPPSLSQLLRELMDAER